MEVNEVKNKKNHSLIIAIVIVVAIIGLTYLGINLYANYLLKYYEEETDKLVPLAQSYVKANENFYGEDIFSKLDKNKKVTDGLVYVNEDLEVAFAVIYDDTVCYVKYYDSNGYIDNIKPDYCKTFLKIHLSTYDKNDDSNKEDNNDVNNDTNNNENNNNSNNDTNNDNNNDNDIIIDNEVVKNLYNKYIKYSVETNDYKNMNVNDSSSDVYLVKYAIYGIMKDNNVKISDYIYNVGYYNQNIMNADMKELYKYGYKITTEQIKQSIKKYFGIERNIDFTNLELNFSCDSDIASYYVSDGYYRLISDSTIPKTGCGSEGVYSKLTKYEISGNNIFIYTDYLLADFEMGGMIVNSSADNPLTSEYDVNAQQCYDYDSAKACILDKYSSYVGKFKHTFTKNSDGNYYWVSTQKIN